MERIYSCSARAHTHTHIYICVYTHIISHTIGVRSKRWIEGMENGHFLWKHRRRRRKKNPQPQPPGFWLSLVSWEPTPTPLLLLHLRCTQLHPLNESCKTKVYMFYLRAISLMYSSYTYIYASLSQNLFVLTQPSYCLWPVGR